MSLTTRVKGFYVYGGMSVGRLLTENCTVVDSPQQLQLRKTSTGWLPIGSAAGSYTLPWWDISAAATFQSNPGPQITAGYPVPSSSIMPWNELDFRLTRTFRLSGASQFQVMADLYNVFNAHPVVTLNTTYGPNWHRPQTILPARFVKVGRS